MSAEHDEILQRSSWSSDLQLRPYLRCSRNISFDAGQHGFFEAAPVTRQVETDPDPLKQTDPLPYLPLVSVR